MHISLKSPEDIERMRVAGRLAAEVLQVVAPHVKPGVSTWDLDQVARAEVPTGPPSRVRSDPVLGAEPVQPNGTFQCARDMWGGA